ncbi:ribosome biogenesis GTP-binding protein YihA/YsxC [Idiomarina piscisalsi]|uniref:ribosome biogenesis GTP-binding protein YihA/YsxC n=1 Tax=Idiomarina piscisalsi TaxID=1096243 RepID=UPI001382CAEC|nr:ribosome biogenesis GTP-binding protein YihA/YsxC [Idiomarina piscisalsi]MTJ01770.1 YihA family ribosome biogenesis GTP-binding protein [Idiomarina piscisalsi]
MSMKPLNYASASFVTSAPDITKLPPDTGIEIAFAGRSNAGKSSALNTLTRQKALARTSKTPGRTQLINVFELDSGERLIDLPGYGFAKVPMAVKEKWQKALAEYLQKRDSLKGIVVLMDIRHPFRETDQELIYWAADCGIPVLALLTKADKLKQGPRKSTVLQARQAAIAFNGDVQVEAFSSLKRIGVEQLENKLNEWFGSQDDG